MRPIGWDLARRLARRAMFFTNPMFTVGQQGRYARAEVLDFRRHKGHISRRGAFDYVDDQLPCPVRTVS